MSQLDKQLSRAIKSDNIAVEAELLMEKIRLNQGRISNYEYHRLIQIDQLKNYYHERLLQIDRILFSLDNDPNNGVEGHVIRIQKMKKRLLERQLLFLSKLGCKAPNKRIEMLKQY